MGWSYSCNPSFGRKAQIDAITKGNFFADYLTPLEHRVVGNCVWSLLEDKVDGSKSMAVTLIRSGGRGCGYGYKGVHEDMGPTEVNCPQSLLDRCTEPKSEWAKEWRAKVRKYHADKKNRPQPETGKLIRYGGQEYRLHTPAGSRRGWHVVRVGDGRMFRMPARQLSCAVYL